MNFTPTPLESIHTKNQTTENQSTNTTVSTPKSNISNQSSPTQKQTGISIPWLVYTIIYLFYTMTVIAYYTIINPYFNNIIVMGLTIPALVALLLLSFRKKWGYPLFWKLLAIAFFLYDMGSIVVDITLGYTLSNLFIFGIIFAIPMYIGLFIYAFRFQNT